MRISLLLKSTSVRLSLAYAGIVCGAFLFAAVLIWIGVREGAEQEIRQYISLEVHAIETELRSEGIDAAIAAIRARAERPGALEYWVTDARGAPLFGDLPQMDGAEGWRWIDLERDTPGAEARDDMLVLSRRLPSGIRLTVGEDLRRVDVFRRQALHTLIRVGAGAVLLCLLAGLLVTRRALKQIAQLNATLRTVAAGDLSARFPRAPGQAGSDIEDVGAGVNAMLERIETLVSGLRRVSRDVAHDLRTPLAHLQQRLEMAQSARSTEDRALAIERAQEKVAEILKSFDAILGLAEIEAGSARRRFERLDLKPLLEAVADAYRPDIEDSGHSLHLSAFAAAAVVGDRSLIMQAVANLLENALRHTPPGTQIRLAVETRQTFAELHVSDDGPGIPDTEYARILQPFARLDASRSTPGSGLGLSIVVAIADLHAATLTLSDAGPGLRVTLSFPAAPAVPRDAPY